MWAMHSTRSPLVTYTKMAGAILYRNFMNNSAQLQFVVYIGFKKLRQLLWMIMNSLNSCFRIILHYCPPIIAKSASPAPLRGWGLLEGPYFWFYGAVRKLWPLNLGWKRSPKLFETIDFALSPTQTKTYRHPHYPQGAEGPQVYIFAFMAQQRLITT